ncbi:MAG TPA: NAD-dependent epimerase/dehydratase family protein [Gaiellaceae bacterium]|nr:NAD-dependent epimerase/dehydratase family protein [Gaiellaceae bacterium]
MKYVVTGAAGFIASHLAEALLAAGHEVRAIDCFTGYYDPELKRENAAAFPVEPLDLSTDELDFRGADGVFHLAGQPGVHSFGDVFPLYVRHNELASQRVFEAAAAAGARVVFSSSSSVYGDAEAYPTPETAEPRPRSPYGITKLACEHLARAYGADFGLDCVVLRYFTVYGPRQRPDMFMARVVRALAEGGAFTLYGDGEQSRSFTYVADVVRATVDSMARAPSGAIYNVGGGEEATVAEAIHVLQRVADRTLDVTRAPRAPGDVARTKADTSRIRADLGWEPAVPLEDGLRRQWESAR